jgi:MATE family multidrug resistance protein
VQLTTDRQGAATAELRTLVKLALPLVAGQLLLFGTGFIETLLAGHLGPLVLGAVAVGNSVFMLPMMMLQGVMFAVPPAVSQLDGAGLRRETGIVFGQALWLAMLLGVFLALVLRLCAWPLVELLAIDPTLAEGVAAFLRAIAWGLPALGLFMACRGLSDGLSMTRPTMWFGLLMCVALLPIGYVLMYGFAWFPGLGAWGSGLAMAAVEWIGAVAFLVHVTFGHRYRGIGPRRLAEGPDLRLILRLLRLGVPMAISVVLEVGMFSAASIAIGRFGAATVSAHQVALNVGSLTFMVPLGLAGAITVRVGNAVGRGDRRGARLAGLVGIALALGTQSLCAAAMLLAPAAIAQVYTAEPEMITAVATLLGLAGLFQVSDGIQVAAGGALRGMGDTRVPMLITLVSYWGIGFPIGLALAFPAGMAAPGMWIGLMSGLSVAACLLTMRFLHRTRPSTAI